MIYLRYNYRNHNNAFLYSKTTLIILNNCKKDGKIRELKTLNRIICSYHQLNHFVFYIPLKNKGRINMCPLNVSYILDFSILIITNYCTFFTNSKTFGKSIFSLLTIWSESLDKARIMV